MIQLSFSAVRRMCTIRPLQPFGRVEPGHRKRIYTRMHYQCATQHSISITSSRGVLQWKEYCSLLIVATQLRKKQRAPHIYSPSPSTGPASPPPYPPPPFPGGGRGPDGGGGGGGYGGWGEDGGYPLRLRPLPPLFTLGLPPPGLPPLLFPLELPPPGLPPLLFLLGLPPPGLPPLLFLLGLPPPGLPPLLFPLGFPMPSAPSLIASPFSRGLATATTKTAERARSTHWDMLFRVGGRVLST